LGIKLRDLYQHRSFLMENENIAPVPRTPKQAPLSLQTKSLPRVIKDRAQSVFDKHRQEIFVQTDRMMGALLVCEWLAGVVIALIVSPLAWEGSKYATHPHVWMAALLGGAIVAVPVGLVLVKPGSVITRHAVAVGQMLFSALLIHLTGGRIETHFHIFGSLAILGFYRDWPVLVTAAAVVAIDHIARGFFAPVSVYGVDAIQPLRWLEHAWWVVFEVFFLIRMNMSQVLEMQQIAIKRVEIEQTRGQVDDLEEQRRQEQLDLEQRREAELVHKEHSANVVKLSDRPIIGQKKDGTIFSWNSAAQLLFGYTEKEIIGKHIKLIVPSQKQQEIDELIAAAKSGKSVDRMETTRLCKDGSKVNVSIRRAPIKDKLGNVLGVSEVIEESYQGNTLTAAQATAAGGPAGT
jgi:PAS domain S-box-containing protein